MPPRRSARKRDDASSAMSDAQPAVHATPATIVDALRDWTPDGLTVVMTDNARALDFVARALRTHVASLGPVHFITRADDELGDIDADGTWILHDIFHASSREMRELIDSGKPVIITLRSIQQLGSRVDTRVRVNNIFVGPTTLRASVVAATKLLQSTRDELNEQIGDELQWAATQRMANGAIDLLHVRVYSDDADERCRRIHVTEHSSSAAASTVAAATEAKSGNKRALEIDTPSPPPPTAPEQPARAPTEPAAIPLITSVDDALASDDEK